MQLWKRIRGVVANYLASQVKTPGSIPTSTIKIHDIYGAIWKNDCV